MFGKKRKEYEAEILKLNLEINELRREIIDLECDKKKLKITVNDLENAIDSMTKLTDTIPEDCKQGEWCKACEFVKEYQISQFRGGGVWSYVTRYMCGKGESCQHFVQRKEEE